MEGSEILQIARELGVEDEEVEEIAKPQRKFFSPFISSAILGFLIGFIIGIFFPSVISGTMYPYRKGLVSGPVPGKSKSRIIMTLLGIISFVFGFTSSSQLLFIYERHWPLLVPAYGVFRK